MTVSAVASAVNHSFFHSFRNLECAGFIFVQRPEVILLVKIGLAASRLILLELFVTGFQQFAVTQRFDTYILFLAGRAVAGKGEDIGSCLDHRVNDIRYFVDVGAGYRSHDHAADTRTVDAADFLQGNVEAARLAEPVVGLAHAVQRELVFFAAEVFQPAADLVGQMEGIAQDGEGDAVLLHQGQQLPEIRVQDGVAAGDVKVGQPAVDIAKVQAVVKGILHLRPGHGIQRLAVVFRKDIAVLATLVALVGDVPLEREILLHRGNASPWGKV